MPRAAVESLNMVLDKQTQADSSGATAFPTGSPWTPGGSHHREGKGCTLCPAVVTSGHVWEEEEKKRKEEGGPGSLVAGGTVGDRAGQCPGVMARSCDRNPGGGSSWDSSRQSDRRCVWVGWGQRVGQHSPGQTLKLRARREAKGPQVTEGLQQRHCPVWIYRKIPLEKVRARKTCGCGSQERVGVSRMEGKDGEMT